MYCFSGSNVFSKFSSTVYGARCGQPNQDGLGQSGYGLRAQLFALHVTRSTCHNGQCSQRDDVYEVLDSEHGYATSQRYAVINFPIFFISIALNSLCLPKLYQNVCIYGIKVSQKIDDVKLSIFDDLYMMYAVFHELDLIDQP